MRTAFGVLAVLLVCSANTLAQSVNEYLVLRAPGRITIDGKLDEPAWKAARPTSPFVIYDTGAAPKQATVAKMLWDDQYLYIAIEMSDKDVWAATKAWKAGDKCLCMEEVAEVFIDADGDGLNYLETEVNPFGAIMPLRMDKEYAKGGTGDYTWTCKGLKVGIQVNGTLNDSTDLDKMWTCELAFPYDAIAFSAPTQSFPPKPGSFWRINVYRYEYPRPAVKNGEELSAWNMTDGERGFHAPDRFGKIVFSKKAAGR